MDCSRPYKDRAGNIISSVNFHCQFERGLLTETYAPILDRERLRLTVHPCNVIQLQMRLNMTTKNFKISGQDIKQLIKPMGGCMATDKITVEGDSGWRFLSGTESQEYADNPDHWAIYDVNTIANYDASIIEYLDSPVGTELQRIKGTNTFRALEL